MLGIRSESRDALAQKMWVIALKKEKKFYYGKFQSYELK